MKILFTFAILLIISNSAIARTLNYYNPQNPDIKLPEIEKDEKSGKQSLQITPLESCLNQLDEADIIDIRKNYMRPYSECLKRLETKQREKNTLNFTKPEEKSDENKKNKPKSPDKAK